MIKSKLSSRGARIVKALEEFADDLSSGIPIESKYTVRPVKVIPKPSPRPGGGAGRRGTDRRKPG
jgi:hypothetical protein